MSSHSTYRFLWIAFTFVMLHINDARGQERNAVILEEDTEVILHNPDMGWVIYENYPLDQDPQGSSTLLTLPDELFPLVDQVAIMFSWADIERSEGEFDFSRVDHAYDYWRKRGKEIQLRVSAESLLWWSKRTPPSGHGIPEHVLAHIPVEQKQTHHESDLPYTVVDARNPVYQERLSRFLNALNAHFAADSRPVTLIDLRGFGLWGEWHRGYHYSDAKQRREALCAILDLWSKALPNHFLSLSYSYDPEGPKEYFAGPTEKFDPAFTTHYRDFLNFSAFDHALTKPNITFRRDGCGGAVHSNERLLCENAFATLSKGPFMSEFLGGYGSVKKAGAKWLNWMIDDALSLHPNYVCVLGWQGADARDFLKEQPALALHGLRTMGYRLAPLEVSHPKTVTPHEVFTVDTQWTNRGVGRAPRDFHLELSLHTSTGEAVAAADAGALPTSKWTKGSDYTAKSKVTFQALRPGQYELRMQLRDPVTKRVIQIPIADAKQNSSYVLGPVTVR